MGLQSQQIIARACAQARTPAFIAQGGQYLNAILSDLCETYDFDLARGDFNFNLNPNLNAITSTNPNIIGSSGPYALPADYLRAKKGDIMWFQLGVAYVPVPLDLEELDALVQQAGLASYPYWFATDMSKSPPQLYVYPPPSGAFPLFGRYYRQMPDIATPESSVTVPWFPNQRYLIKQVAAMLMDEADDERAPGFYKQAEDILRGYLNLKDDGSNRAKRVTLDRRRFGTRFNNLPNTKTVGW